MAVHRPPPVTSGTASDIPRQQQLFQESLVSGDSVTPIISTKLLFFYPGVIREGVQKLSAAEEEF